MSERVRITVGSGDVRVIGEPRDGIDVEGASASAAAGAIVIRGDSDSVTVRVPTGTDLVVGSESGDVRLDGELGATSITTESADIRVEDVASIDARTESGALRVEVSRGEVRLKADSADVELGRADGDVRISSESGDIEIGEARGAVAAKTVSGDIRVYVTGTDPVRVETVSGRITVSLPEGVKPAVLHRSESGQHRVGPEAGDDLVIAARSVSGDVIVAVA